MIKVGLVFSFSNFPIYKISQVRNQFLEKNTFMVLFAFINDSKQNENSHNFKNLILGSSLPEKSSYFWSASQLNSSNKIKWILEGFFQTSY